MIRGAIKLLLAGPGRPTVPKIFSHLLPQLILLNELLELLSQLHVLLPQLGVVGIVLLHLCFDLIECHLEMKRGLLAPLLVFPEPLGVLLLPKKNIRGCRPRTCHAEPLLAFTEPR